ncbi:MAG: acyl-CoA thioesterase [Xanthomonadales bacterium]|nr:acyl-CoA thioesterase [Xanthomonadales bacterium]
MDEAASNDQMISVYKGVAQPWECDSLGHLTTRFYTAMFDDASYHFLFELFGWTGASDEAGERAFVDVRHELDFRDEILAGELLEIRAGLERVGTKSLVARYDMIKRDSGGIAASLQATYVLFDLQSRQSLALDDTLREQAASRLPASS